jgi:hypothetical protein
MLSTRSNSADGIVREECRDAEVLKTLASILAVGYLRYRRRHKDSLDLGANPSLHGHEVDAVEKGGFGSDADSAPRGD